MKNMKNRKKIWKGKLWSRQKFLQESHDCYYQLLMIPFHFLFSMCFAWYSVYCWYICLTWKTFLFASFLLFFCVAKKYLEEFLKHIASWFYSGNAVFIIILGQKAEKPSKKFSHPIFTVLPWIVANWIELFQCHSLRIVNLYDKTLVLSHFSPSKWDFFPLLFFVCSSGKDDRIQRNLWMETNLI